MVYQHTETEIKGAERNCQARADDTPVKYTPQQIDDYCEKVLNLCLSARPEGELMFDGVQIIRQQQKEIAERDKLDKENFEALRECSLSAQE